MSQNGKKLLAAAASLLVALILVAGCGPTAAPTIAPAAPTTAPTAPPAAESPTAAPAVGEQEPIIIGAVFNATGWMAAYDQPPRKGALLAVDEINKAGGVLGRQLQLIELDGKSDPPTVANVTLQLIQQGADVILAPADFDVGAPASQAAQEAGLVGLSTGATSPLYGSQALGDMQFTLGMWNNIMSGAAAEFAYTEKGWQTAYVVSDTSIDYSLSLGEYFAEHFATLGGEVLGTDTYIQGDQDFSAQIQRIQALENPPDVLFISSYMPDLGTIVRQTRAAGIDVPIMGGDTYDAVEFFDAVGTDLGTNIYFATHSWLGSEASPDMARFIELHQAKFGIPPETAFTALGWDAVHVLAQAIEEAGSTEGKAVAKVMEDRVFEGLLTGRLDWTSAEEGHLPQKEVAIVMLDQGQPAFQGWIFPTNVPEP